MKKLFSLLLALAMVCCLSGLTVYADVAEDLAQQTDSYSERLTEIIDRTGDYKGCTVGRSLPVVSYSSIKTKNLNFDGIKALSSSRVGLLVKDGEIIGELEFNGDHLSAPANTDSKKLYNVLTAFDGDLMIVATYTDRYVVRAKEPETLYDYTSFGKTAPPTVWEYTLSDYLLCYSYMNLRKAEWPGKSHQIPFHYRPYVAIDDQVILDAEAYWEEINNPKLQPEQRKSLFAFGFFGTIAIIAAGLITLAVVLNKRRKQREAKEVSRE